MIEHNTDPISFERQPQAVKFEENFAKSRKTRLLTSLRIHSIRTLNSKLTKRFSAKIGQRLNRF
ncbi:hypothetical protein BHC25_04710 [Mannheimia haemolytica]|nr:hypothetical protein BHC25_04710 [Mannheimia haemolytica]